MALVTNEKEAPQISTPVGSIKEVEALGCPTRNIATCSRHTQDNRGCPFFDICDREHKGERPRFEVVRRISGNGGIRVYHAECFNVVPKEATASDNQELYEVIGGEGDVYVGRGSVKKHPKRDPNCNDCAQGKCEAWIDVEDLEYTCPTFPPAAQHRELIKFERKNVARRGSAIKQKAAVKTRLLGESDTPETHKAPAPEIKRRGAQGS